MSKITFGKQIDMIAEGVPPNGASLIGYHSGGGGYPAGSLLQKNSAGEISYVGGGDSTNSGGSTNSLLGDRILKDKSILKIEDNTLKYDGGTINGWLAVVGDNNGLDQNGQAGTTPYFDSLGNLLVTSQGYSDDGSNFDGNTYTFVSKFDPLGELLWKKSVGSINYEMESSSIITDLEDNIIVSVGGNIIKLDANGNILWTKVYERRLIYSDDSGQSNNIYVGDIVIDSSNNIIVGYYTNGAMLFYKYEPNSDLIVSKSYTRANMPYKDWTSISSMVIEPTSNSIYVSVDRYGFGLAKLDSNLDMLWNNEYGRSSVDLVLASNGDIILAQWDSNLVRISPNGTELSRCLIASNSDIYGLAISDSDDIYLLMSSRNQDSNSSLTLLKVNAVMTSVEYAYELSPKTNGYGYVDQYWYNRCQGISVRDNNIALVGYCGLDNKNTDDLIIMKSVIDVPWIIENDQFIVVETTDQYTIGTSTIQFNNTTLVSTIENLVIGSYTLEYIIEPITVEITLLGNSDIELLKSKVIAKSFVGDGSKLTNIPSYVLPYGKLYLYSKGPGLIIGKKNVANTIEPTDLVQGWISHEIYWQSAVYLGDIYGGGPSNTNNYKAGIEINFMDALPVNFRIRSTSWSNYNISSNDANGKTNFANFIYWYGLGGQSLVGNFEIELDSNSTDYGVVTANVNINFNKNISTYSGLSINYFQSSGLGWSELINVDFLKDANSINFSNTTTLTDIYPLRDLPNIEILDCANCGITSLSNYTLNNSSSKIKSLNLSNNAITDFGQNPLPVCEYLDLSNTLISNLGSMFDYNWMSMIKYFDLSGASISSAYLSTIINYLNGLTQTGITFKMNSPSDQPLLAEDQAVYDQLVSKGNSILVNPVGFVPVGSSGSSGSSGSAGSSGTSSL